MTRRSHPRVSGFAATLALAASAFVMPANAQQPAWSPVPVFANRQLFALAYDFSRQRVVIFGGESDRNDTWEWDGQRWDHRDAVCTLHQLAAPRAWFSIPCGAR